MADKSQSGSNNNDEQAVIQRAPFVVDDTPYVCWDWHLRDKNLTFLQGIDGRYFEYVVRANIDHLDNDNDKHYAALNIRIAYSQALETLFALLGSLIQAPDCSVGWMLAYRNSELTSLVNKISNYTQVRTRLELKPVSWQRLSEGVHCYLPHDDKKKEWLVKGFGECWGQFARDFVKSELSNEYNSIKHGLRTQLGGFTLAIGEEEKPGVAAPPESMKTLGGSTFGTSFFFREKIGDDKRNFRPRNHSRNWTPENLVNAVALASMSITNVVSCLRILNKDSPETCEFRNPDRKEAFREPWRRSPGVTDAGLDTVINPEDIKPWDKDEILNSYKKAED